MFIGLCFLSTIIISGTIVSALYVNGNLSSPKALKIDNDNKRDNSNQNGNAQDGQDTNNVSDKDKEKDNPKEPPEENTQMELFQKDLPSIRNNHVIDCSYYKNTRFVGPSNALRLYTYKKYDPALGLDAKY